MFTTIIATVFITLMVYNLVFAIIAIVTKEKYDIMLFLGAGIWTFFFMCIGRLIGIIKLTYFRKNYDLFDFYYYSTDEDKPRYAFTLHIHKKMQKKFIQQNKKFFCTKIEEGKAYKCCPSKRAYIKTVKDLTKIDPSDYIKKWFNIK